MSDSEEIWGWKRKLWKGNFGNEALKGTNRIYAEEALQLLVAAHEPSVTFNKESSNGFVAYSQRLHTLYRTLEASIPTHAKDATREAPHFSLKFIHGLLVDFVSLGPHGIQVRRLLLELTPSR